MGKALAVQVWVPEFRYPESMQILGGSRGLPLIPALRRHSGIPCYLYRQALDLIERPRFKEQVESKQRRPSPLTSSFYTHMSVSGLPECAHIMQMCKHTCSYATHTNIGIKEIAKCF